jgi:hypothetical protein
VLSDTTDRSWTRLAGESEQNVPQADIPVPGSATNAEQQDAQSKANDINATSKTAQPSKKAYTTPKIWMDFDDFCSCFTSIVVFHNPRGYQYAHKHTELKVRGNVCALNFLYLISDQLTETDEQMFIFSRSQLNRYLFFRNETKRVFLCLSLT